MVRKDSSAELTALIFRIYELINTILKDVPVKYQAEMYAGVRELLSTLVEVSREGKIKQLKSIKEWVDNRIKEDPSKVKLYSDFFDQAKEVGLMAMKNPTETISTLNDIWPKTR